MKPFKILGFIVVCLLLLGLLSLLFPKEGIRLSEEKTLNFPSVRDVFKGDSSKGAESEKKDAEKLAQLQDQKKQIMQKQHKDLNDTLTLMKVEAQESTAQFYFPNDNRAAFEKLFDELEKVSRDKTFFRIMHYGDSQIEMDRISSYLRDKLQSTYGGNGPGILPALEVTPKYTVAEETVGSWRRRLAFGTEDGRARHNRYGPMAYFSQKESETGSVIISARDKTSLKNRTFQTCKVLVGALQEKLDISVAYNNKTAETISLQPSNTEQLAEFKLDSAGSKIGLKFSGARADIQGIAIDGNYGIALDNVPMRGCSGTIFKRIDANTLRKGYDLLGVKMLILQYGGNALPGMKSKAQADAYGKHFYEQLMYLKSIKPDIILLVIGPADMGVRVNGVMQTHPHLENVRDALKSATLMAGGVYWDMYKAMGGRNSMVEWVKAKPALGSPDYIHFTQKGAARIAEIFYESFLKEQEIYNIKKKLGGS